MCDRDADQALWAGLRASAPKAYRSLEERVARICRPVCGRAGAGREHVESVLQDVLISIWEFARRTEEAPANLDGLLYWRVRGVLSNRLRASRRRDSGRGEEIFEQPVESAHPAEALHLQELQAALRDCRERLKTMQRNVWEARYERDLSPADTAGELGLKPAEVALHLFRARRSLEACLGRKGLLP